MSPTLIIIGVTCAASLTLQGIATVNQIRHNAKMFDIIIPGSKHKN